MSLTGSLVRGLRRSQRVLQIAKRCSSRGAASTFGDLRKNVESLLNEFDQSDFCAAFARGERLALLAPPSAAGVSLIHACLERGVVMVPLNLRFTHEELVFAVQAAGARWLVVTEETLGAGDELARASGCGVIRLGEGSGHSARLAILRSPASITSSSKRAESEADRDWILSEGGALILFTSGTSGRPKAALLSQANLRASARASLELLGSEPNDRWLCCMPLFHIGGLSILIRSVLSSTSVVLQRGFDPAEVSRALDEDAITRVSWVATMLSRVLDDRGNRPSPKNLELVLLGGGPASDALLSRAERLGYPLALTYGLTEAASQVATRPPDRKALPGSPASGGLEVLPGTEIRVMDDAGLPVSAGVAGEIEVRGPTVMHGYFGDAEATERALRDGWLRTGDVGELDSAGRLRVLDRRSDLIVSGGENVYPAEVESVLTSFPGVAEAAVVAMPDANFGARPRAFIVCEDGESVEAESLLGFCREQLAGFKVPVRVEFCRALPRTASGKLLRRNLVEGAR